MVLNFSDNNKQKALDIIKSTPSSSLLPEDALVLLLKDIKYEDLSNLCNVISTKLNISLEESYKLIQNPKNQEEKRLIYNSYMELLNNKGYLGNNVINNTINTSSWINHCMYSAILASKLASLIGLDPNYAFSYGLLHDYGRKYSHDFSHVIKGFEALSALGYNDIAKGCLTHSFINAGRNCNNEVVNDSFYIDSSGKECYNENDDMTDVLDEAVYTPYDSILNITDLMATSDGITSPSIRIDDIATRRPGIDNSPNRKYFYVSFYNLLVNYLNEINTDMGFTYINYSEVSLEEIKKEFSIISDKITAIVSNKGNNRGL